MNKITYKQINRLSINNVKTLVAALPNISFFDDPDDEEEMFFFVRDNMRIISISFLPDALFWSDTETPSAPLSTNHVEVLTAFLSAAYPEGLVL